MTCRREKELLEQIEQTGEMYKVSALQLIKAGKRIAELEALNGALCRDSAGFVQDRDALAAQVASFGALMTELLDQLGERENYNGDAPGHSHEIAGVWDSNNGELSGKPCAWCTTWKQSKAMRESYSPAADILRQLDAGVARDIATNWLPNVRRRESESSLTKTAHNRAVDDCIKHVLSYVAAKEASHV